MGKSKIINDIFYNSLPENDRDEFQSEIANEVLSRGKALALTIIVLEIGMIFMVIIRRYSYERYAPCYLGMYVIMIAAMLIYLVLYRGILHKKNMSTKLKDTTIMIFTTFILYWSALISILDQLNDEQIVVYLLAIITIGVMSYIKPIKLLVIYLSCQLLSMLTISHVQISESVAFGNLVNSAILMTLAWVISIRLYKSRMNDFMNRKTILIKNEKLNEINQQLTDTNDRLNASNNKLQEVNQKLKEANDKLELLAITDPMSGLFNRRKFDEALSKEWDRRKRYHENISLIFIDIDFFKRFNDNYGHQSGDICIKRIAEAIMNISRRASDIAARFGGEEFVVVVPRVNNEIAFKIAEEIRKNVENLKIPHGSSDVSDYVTVSLGVYTTIPTNNITISEFIEKADKALYKAKQNNRNQVVVFEE